jgi:hypothetical protein
MVASLFSFRASSRCTADSTRAAGSREVASWWPNALAIGPKLWPPGEATDRGQRGKSCALPCHHRHASPCERGESEKMPREVEVGGSVKMKGGECGGERMKRSALPVK